MLTKRAFLNAIQLIVDQIARILVSFIVTPILVTYLGGAVFGIWQVLQKASNQLMMLDGRSGEVLKWTVAAKQSDNDDEQKRRDLGAAVIALIVYSPLLILAYSLFVWLLPIYMTMTPGKALEARIALSILGFNAFLMAVAVLIEGAIRGMNMAYKLLGVQGGILIIGGALTALAAYAGYGLKGVALAQVITSVLFIGSYFRVAANHVEWFGISHPGPDRLRQVLKRSGWFSLWGFVSTWVLVGDVIVLGFFVESEQVSGYVLTMFTSQTIIVAVLSALASVLPGVAGIIGKGELAKAAGLRYESMLFSWWISLSVCLVLLMLNSSFVSLWVGDEFYVGNDINALIILCSMQLVFIRHDGNMLSLALDIKEKTLLALGAGLASLVLMILLIPEYGLHGLCLALLLGRGTLSIMYPRVLSRFLNVESQSIRFAWKFWFTVGFLFLGWQMAPKLSADSWLELAALSVGLGLVSVVIVFLIGMRVSDRALVINRLGSLVD